METIELGTIQDVREAAVRLLGQLGPASIPTLKNLILEKIGNDNRVDQLMAVLMLLWLYSALELIRESDGV